MNRVRANCQLHLIPKVHHLFLQRSITYGKHFMDSISSTLLNFSPWRCKTNRTAPVNTWHIIYCTSTQDFFSSEGPGYLESARQEDRRSHRFIEKWFCFVPTDPLYQPPLRPSSHRCPAVPQAEHERPQVHPAPEPSPTNSSQEAGTEI